MDLGFVWKIFQGVGDFCTKRFLKKEDAKQEIVNHITKNQFDVEFKIYQELSEMSFSMLYEVSQLFPAGLDYVPQDKDERQKVYQERYKKAQDELIKFQNRLLQVAPFISKKIYDLFDELRAEARLQVVFYPDFVLNPDREYVKELSKEKHECMKRTPQLTIKREHIMEVLREYLSLLKTKE